MSEIQFIVDKLSEPPFSKDMRLVEFDEKSPLELIETLQEIVETVDPQQKIDVREENEEIRATRMMALLQMLKFQIAPEQQVSFHEGLRLGDKAAVYPVMYWLLQRVPQLQKRSYLARYLMPVDVPSEFLQDSSLGDLQDTYKEHQAEFKLLHKQVDQIRGTNLRPQELRRELTQLEDERRTLEEKIAKLKRSTGDEPGFKEMLEVTSRLRKAQEEESRLADKAQEQRVMLMQSEMRLGEAEKRLSQLNQTSGGSSSAEAVLQQLAQDVDGLEAKAMRELPRDIQEKSQRLRQLERERAEPHRSKEDVEDMANLARQLERENAQIKEQVETVVSTRHDSNLAMFRQQAALAERKLQDKEEQLEKLNDEMNRLSREVEDREARMARMVGGGAMDNGGGGGAMTKEQFKQYGAMLREKTQTYKRVKAELAELRAESVVLARTEQILKGRDANLEEFLSQLESEKGVSGYRKTHAELVAKSELTAQVDEMKGATLAEISTLVNRITSELNTKRERLRPHIEERKAKRATFQEVERLYIKSRATYDKVAVGLEVERQQLEQECDAFQDDCLREESRFHYLQSLVSITEAQMERVEQEEKWKKGDGKLLPDFTCYQELYNHKLKQQESLSKQLRRQQKLIKEGEGTSAEQRRMFADLQTLLRYKLAVSSKAAEKDKLGMFNENEAYLKAMDYGGGGRGVGGANIMTIDQIMY